jgi:hypothetical protein
MSKRTAEADSTGGEPQPRKRAVMTKADWERVERDAQRGEREPDPAQINFLSDETAT